MTDKIQTSKDSEIWQDADGRWFKLKDTPICARRRRNCDPNKGGCGYHFTFEDHESWHCPNCQKDRYCRQAVDFPGDACKFHGGASLKGAESPQYKHGDFSKYMPSDLRERYEEFLHDPTRLSLEKEMAITRAMLSERVQALEAVHSAEAWNRLKKVYDSMRFAARQQQVERHARLFNELGEIINEGLGIDSTRKDAIKLIEQERKLVDSQRQLYIDMGEFITRGMALSMLSNFLEAVKDNVYPLEGGPKALTAISTTIRGMAGALGGGQPERRSPKTPDSDNGMAD